ncbi:flagellar biosynthesis anti-sigma factor FlgM [Rubrivivax gelatinosus]|uniref:Negative regulator of flagellin synthesis n=2 Tax=Rubrivivax gelatinosus TaxID=28068 RepID=I0HPX2_RUBGI|nr:flagellar biosynthesis anti-sigma factor FlgM [Rubrivivax gelatinosus]MBG6081651.1 negative regulator of flagellin synthesis FlgM [Rubrivivax gelatinosus]BAL95059.1 negative regulator of flagellin synthesis FlgM [Rubrivivax gelatinosus IL144]
MEFKMKIGLLDTTSSANSVNGERKATSQTRTPDSTAEPSAKVQLSAAALAATDSGDGSFDSAKVGRIAQAIRDGDYQVNHEAIADKLISNAQELLGRTYNR